MQPPRRVRGDALEASQRLLEEMLPKGFVEPSLRLRESLTEGA